VVPRMRIGAVRLPGVNYRHCSRWGRRRDQFYAALLAVQRLDEQYSPPTHGEPRATRPLRPRAIVRTWWRRLLHL